MLEYDTDLAHIRSAWGHIRSESVQAVAAEIKTLSLHKRDVLLDSVGALLADPSRVKEGDDRVYVAKLACAFLPRTYSSLKRLVREGRGVYSYEMLFSLFCFVDEVPSLQLGHDIFDKLGILICEFIRNVPSDTAHAAMMAGDLLGHHWPRPEATDMLLELASSARFVEGRLAVIRGLELQFRDVEDPDRRRVCDALKSLSTTDRSEVVREAAASCLQKNK